MYKLVVFVAVVALAGKTVAFPSKQIHSEKLVHRTKHVTASNIHEGTFTVRLDHARAQNPKFVEFVSANAIKL